MLNKNGYLPLGQDNNDIPQEDSTTITIEDNEDHNTNDQTRNSVVASSMQQTQQSSSDNHSSHVSLTIPSNEQDHATDDSSRKVKHRVSKSDIITTAPTLKATPMRPSVHSTSSAPAAPTDSSAVTTSSPSTFQFPRFGVKNKSLLGLSSFSSSSNNNESSMEDSSHSSGVRRAVSSSTVPDLLNIRRKHRGKTTESGPREIAKSQKQRVLREIRPDHENLPEELLREQARSGAAVDALANAGLYQSSQEDETTRLLDSNGNNTTDSNGGTASNEQRRSLLGSGEGFGFGIGLGGKANSSRPKWLSRSLGRRQRRVLSSVGRENDQRVIQSSVFSPLLLSVNDGQPVIPAPALTPDHAEPMTSERFVSIVDSVKEAMNVGVQPERIVQGSSGSYFCKNSEGKTVGVFKPKNEEPYGQLNPKWAKWIHRNLFPCCFGRSCLIPNLGYISEAATSLVDRRLKLNIVPCTEVVWLSSPSFHYDYLDRRAAQPQNGAKPLPEKVGSFQLFLRGFSDANVFMRDHPWPVELDTHGKGKYSSKKGTHRDSDESSVSGSSTGSGSAGSLGHGHGHGHGPDKPGFNWTPDLQQQFREQFEKMIILDYLIRNTDRGLDNWMIRYCEKEGISIVAGPPSDDHKGNLQQQEPARRSSRVGDLLGLYSDRGSLRSTSPSLRETTGKNSMLATPPGTPPHFSTINTPSNTATMQAEEPQRENPRSNSPDVGKLVLEHSEESVYDSTHVHVAAIDNGLAFPFKHPDSWRSYPYGWLFLPHNLISQPFTKATRDHFLPLLSSPTWWRETIADLRRLFSIDSDFDQGMFDKQMAVMKGQGWNIVETLKNLEHGPMDLCRRVAVVVWDEEVTLEPGVSASRLRRQDSRQSLAREASGGYGVAQGYTNTQPKPMTMDARSPYSNYGSITTTTDRLSNPKTLSTSSTAVGESIPFLLDQKNSLKQASFKQASYKQASLPHLVIEMGDDNEEDDVNSQPRHDSFRQVVSDGEYDLSDDFDEDDDEFSYDEEYDDFEENGLGVNTADGLSTSQNHLGVNTKDKMISIDMALSNPEAVVKNHRRRHSHQSEDARPRRSRQLSGGQVEEEAVTDRRKSLSPDPMSYHRRSRTDQDDKTGTVRFDTTSSTVLTGKPRDSEGRGGGGDFETSASTLLLQSPPSKSARNHPFDPPEDKIANRIREEADLERGRSFFSRGYGAVPSSPLRDSQDKSNETAGGGGGDDTGRLSERPKWADRLRRGLSFDGHLLVGGIGQAARRERYLRKQKQRERELRENRVVLVERIEPVTTNLPYFTWW
ncbi:phosphatidyl inositol kinase [Entomortierella beljakovae]|nr:phosphatidyl inositol kinase [Entomortierella beljakovae]